jgi:hypothetical protein
MTSSSIHSGARLLLSLLLGLVPAVARAQFWTEPGPNPNRYGFDGHVGFNMKASFGEQGLPLNPGPPTGSGLNRTYADGYVLVDISGNQGGLTWNWGYKDPNTISQVPGNDTLLMHSVLSSPGGGGAHGENNDPRFGGDLSFGRVLGRIHKVNVGLDFGFGYTYVDARSQQTASGELTRLTDTYALNGVIPVSGGYQGTFQGPGPLIPDSPASRQMDVVSGSSTIHDQLYANVFGFRLGPFAEIPICRRLNATVGGGLAVAYVTGDFSSSETMTVSGVTPFQLTSSDSSSDWLFGGYASAAVSFELTPETSVAAGVQYFSLGQFNQQASGRTAQLDLRNSVFLTLGFGIRF